MTNVEKEILELIKTKRSIFPASYQNKTIEKTLIEEILACADQAPNHKLTEPWRFVVFTDKGLERLANELASQYESTTTPDTYLEKKSKSIQKKVLQSGAVIAICLHESGKIPRWEEIAAVASAVQNMSIAASALGIGSYWSSTALINNLSSFLKLENNESCIGLFYMGYHDEDRKYGKRSPLESKVRWEG